MQQIAQAAGVSVTTVSHTLSGKRPVNAETADRIRRIIADLGYVPDVAGQRLKTGRGRIIGLAVPDISHSYFARMARGAAEGAEALDYGLIICSSVNAGPRTEKRYFNMLRTRLIDGLIYSANREVTDGDEFSRVASARPIVLADESLPSIDHLPSVVSDNETGGRLAGEHLAALGHRRAIILAGPAGLQSTTDRVRGFRTVMPNSLVLHGDFETTSGYSLVSDLLANGADFTAIFCGNDYMAWGAILRLAEEGIRVPADVSVIGFDDIDIAPLIAPGLTTVRQDTTQMGRRAAELVIRAIEHRDEPIESQVLPVELVVRGSAGAVSAS
jgi:DNA-binding LacI/PurR family transcriptional regulator